MLFRLIPLFCALLTGGLALYAQASPFEDPDPSEPHVYTIMPPLKFEVEGRLKKNVQFWVDIYTKYSTTQGLILDAKYVDIIYEVMDFSHGGHTARAVREAKKKWREILLSVHHKQDHPEKMNAEELRVYKLYENISEPDKFLNAAHRKRIRFQLGEKESFQQGLYYSGRYLPIMEDVFRRQGLPTELTRLPFVESSFNLRARSKVGASGIWQFMRSTGRLFLRINDAVDERNDPIRATEAAAKLLKLNFDSLRSWPLAVTAYNHGRKGMMRAVRRVGSDGLEDVVHSYRSRTFGFASGNFFTELLAAIEVEKNAEKYFPDAKRAPVLRYQEFRVPDYIDLRELTRFLDLDFETVKELNPGLTDAVFAGVKLVPAGYRLRIPPHHRLEPNESARVLQASYSQIPQVFKFRRQRGGSGTGRKVTSLKRRGKHKRHRKRH